MPRALAGAAVSVDRFFQLSILGLVTSGFFAVAGSGGLDAVTLVLTSAGLVLRALMTFEVVRFEVPRRYVTAATLFYIGFFPLDYLFVTRSFLAATIHLVFFLATTKVLTARTNRDYLFTAAIAFLEILAAAMLSASLNFFVFLALYLVFAMAALTSSEIRRSMERRNVIARGGLRRFHPRLAGLALSVALGVLLLTGGLFFMLPRTANSAFRNLIAGGYTLPGFSNQVTLGQIGRIKTSSRAVMHIRFSDPDAPAGLKWRGAALSSFDGRRWFNPPGGSRFLHVENGQITLAENEQRRRADGQRIAYRVEFSGIDTDVLFFAGIPEVLNDLGRAQLIRTATDSYRVINLPVYGFHYEAWSFLPAFGAGAGDGGGLAAAVRRNYLALPKLDPRIPALAQAVTAGQANDSARAAALERHLRTSYGYTLELPSRAESDPVASFLFDRRKGHCEYFASAMTVMLRTLGIPARLVNGFQSGTYNPISGQYVIRASDAHSWVEAYLPGAGWTTFDPTPPDTTLHPASLWSRLSLYMDAAETFWQEWVLSYNVTHQVSLAQRMERSGIRLGLQWLTRIVIGMEQWKQDAWALAARYGLRLIITLVLLACAVRLAPRMWRLLRVRHRLRRVRRGEASVADATLLYDRMLELLRRRGFSKPAWFTPQEFASTLPSSELATLVGEFTQAYNALRFGGHADAAPQLSVLLDKLEQVP